MIYFKSFHSPLLDCVYSLDMLRLNLDFGKNADDFVKFLNRLSGYDLRYEIEYYPSYSAYKYRHLWSIKCPLEEISWSIGLDLGRNADDKTRGFIEFNPNKCEVTDIFQEFWRNILTYVVTSDPVRYDMAIDIPLPRYLCRLVREGKKTYSYLVKDDGVTEYLGQRSSDGFVKLYDKTKESDLDEDLTRLEITLEYGKSTVYSAFPTVLVSASQQSLSLDGSLSKTEMVLVSAIKSSDNPTMYLRQLDYRMRKKIEPYLADTALYLDKQCYLDILKLVQSYTIS